MSIEQWSDLMFPEREGTVTPIYGSVRAINDDGSYEVQLNASSVTTRCAPCCTAMVGDRVLVLIKPNGKCDAIGRLGGEIGGGGSEGGSSSDVDAKIAILEEALTASLKSKTWVFAIRDRNNQETQAGSSAAAGWFNTTCGYKIAGTDDWEDYFYTSTSSISITLKKPGVYRCVFRIHGRLSAASRLGAGWFQGSTEMASDWIYTGSTNACTVVTELILNVEEETSIIPKIYASGVIFTKYVGGHLTNFTIEYLGEL